MTEQQQLAAPVPAGKLRPKPTSPRAGDYRRYRSPLRQGYFDSVALLALINRRLLQFYPTSPTITTLSAR
ncbi:hypothetical protein KCP73_11030 [Salmonella enterica subsp. enterica]|nr:hypothetical protein KCP73_11030 [Salmonella enterica subsp. enterica]